MTDLVQRLRELQRDECNEAADRIEQLERENAELRKNQTYFNYYTENLSKFIAIGQTWYYRSSRGMPHKKTKSLIDAIEFAIQQEQL